MFRLIVLCALGALSRSTVINQQDQRPRILITEWNMQFMVGIGKNITFETLGGGGSVFFQGKDLKDVITKDDHTDFKVKQWGAIWKMRLAIGRQFRKLKRKVKRLEIKIPSLNNTLQSQISSQTSSVDEDELINKLMDSQRFRELTRDHCQSDPCQFGGRCIASLRDFQCICLDGFTEGKTCGDTNECEQLNLCQNGGTCRNTPGLYRCECPSGYHGDHCEINSNTCTPENRMALCGEHGHCYNATGNSAPYSCLCNYGFVSNNHSTNPACVDLDECTTSDAICFPGSECTNTYGSYSCGPCPTGYTGDAKRTCHDINECAVNHGGCSTNPMVECHNTVSGSTCGDCPPGYDGDGRSCVRRGHCSLYNPCDSDTEDCLDSDADPQGYLCHCKDGYTKMDSVCVENPCGVDSCSRVGTCAIKVPGPTVTVTKHTKLGYTCSCPAGHKQPDCAPIDPCAYHDPCENNGTCLLTASGNTYCDCPIDSMWTGSKCDVHKQHCHEELHRHDGTLTYHTKNANQVCSWKIVTPSGTSVKVTKIVVTSHPNDCKKRTLQFYDGPDHTDPVTKIKHMDGCSNSTGFLTSLNELTFVLNKTDESTAYEFLLEVTWESVTASTCPFKSNYHVNEKSIQQGDTITYANGRDDYHCVFIYRAPPKFTVQVQVTINWPARNVTDCNGNVLEIKDGELSVDPQLDQYCDQAYNTARRGSATSTLNSIRIDYRAVTGRNNSVEVKLQLKPGQCGAELTDIEGEVVSPGWDQEVSQYKTLQGWDCVWVINGSSRFGTDGFIEFTFDDVVLPKTTKIEVVHHFIGRRRRHRLPSYPHIHIRHICQDNYVELRDGPNENDRLIGRLCDNRPKRKETYLSASPLLYIRYHADRNVPITSGFSATYKMYCGHRMSHISHGMNGTVTTPNYPGSMPEGTCRYSFDIPQSHVLQLRFKAINFGVRSNCEDNYVKVSSKHRTTPNHPTVSDVADIRTICPHNVVNVPHYRFGDKLQPVDAPPGSLQLEVKSNGNELNKGIEVEYFYMNEDCGGQRIAGSVPGVITSPGYPQNEHRNGMTCRWTITSPDRGRRRNSLRLTFKALDIEPHHDCRYDYVAIYNYFYSSNRRPNHIYCGTKIPPAIYGPPTMVVVFKTDESVKRKGFELAYDIVPATECNYTFSGVAGSYSLTPARMARIGSSLCHLTVSAHNSRQISLTVRNLTVPCEIGYVEIRNGASDQSPPFPGSNSLGRFCGPQSMINQTFLSHGSEITIFVAMAVLDNSSDPAVLMFDYIEYRGPYCGGKMNAHAQEFSSPQWPVSSSQFYHCYYQIHVAPGNYIRLRIFNFEPMADCRSTYIKVTSGVQNSHILTDDFADLHLCANASVTEREFLLKADHVTIEYYTKKYSNERGFYAQYETDCSNVSLSHSSGTIESPGFSLTPASTLGYTTIRPFQCSWTIRASPGSGIEYSLRSNRDASFNDPSTMAMYYQSNNSSLIPINSSDIEHKSTYPNIVVKYNSSTLGIRFRMDYRFDGCGTSSDEPGSSTGEPGFTGAISIPIPKGKGRRPSTSDYHVCQFPITAPVGQRVQLDVESFPIDPQNCRGTGPLVKGDEPEGIFLYGWFTNVSHTAPFKRGCDTLPLSTSRKIWAESFSRHMLVEVRYHASAIDAAADGVFKAWYSFTRDRACGGVIEQSTPGTIYTPAKLDSRTECSWLIRVPGHLRASIRFNKINITGTCMETTRKAGGLTVYDGANATANVLFRRGWYRNNYYGNGSINQRIFATGSEIFVDYMPSYYPGGKDCTGLNISAAFRSECGQTLTAEEAPKELSIPSSIQSGQSCFWTLLPKSPESNIEFRLLINTQDYCTANFTITKPRSSIVEQVCGSVQSPGPRIFYGIGEPLEIRISGNITQFSMSAVYSSFERRCGGEPVYHPRGTIASPGYPIAYPENLDCEWTIPVDRLFTISLVMETIKLENSPNCDDFVEIRKNSRTGRLITRGCRFSDNKKIFESTQGELTAVYVRFSSNNANSNNGFMLHFEQLYRPEIELSDNGYGTIQSVLYSIPTKYRSNYFDSIDPVTQLTLTVNQTTSAALRSANKSLEITIIDYQMPGCVLILQIPAARTFDMITTASVCAQKDEPYLFSPATLEVHLQRNWRTVLKLYKGFKFYYQLAEEYSTSNAADQCKDTVVRVMRKPRSLISPNYPGDYDNNYPKCDWIFRVPFGYHVQLNFTDIDLETNGRSDCHDYIMLIKKDDTHTSSLSHAARRLYNTRICRLQDLPENPIDLRQLNSLRLFTDPSVTRRGFNITYSAVCGSDIFVDSKNSRYMTLRSPGFPRGFASDLDCVYRIETSPGGALVLDFTEFDIAADCAEPDASFTITNGTEVLAYCSDPPTSIELPFSKTTINFKTSELRNFGGFKIRIRRKSSVCGGTYYVQRGQEKLHFESPTDSSGKPHEDIECIWILRADRGHRLAINATVSFAGGSTYSRENQFTVIDNGLDTNINPQCICSCFRCHDSCKFTIKEGASRMGSTLLEVKNSTSAPMSTLFSSTNALYVRFVVFPKVDEKSVAFDVEIATCGGYIHNSVGVVTSPNFPSQAPKANDCGWTIEVPETHAVEFTFDTFDIHPYNYRRPDCMRNYLEVRETNATGDVLFRGCNRNESSSPTAPKLSATNMIYVKFHSDDYHERSKFRMFFNSTRLTCGGEINAGDEGVLTSPGYPGPYPKHRTCVWNFIVPYGRRLRFNFQDFQVGTWNPRASNSPRYCSRHSQHDSLEISEIIELNNIKISRYDMCGDMRTNQFLQTMLLPNETIFGSSRVQLVLTSNQAAQGRGFSLTYDTFLQTECGGRLQTTSQPFLIQSHDDAGLSDYPNNHFCHWIIQNDNSNRSTLLTFSQIDAEDHMNCAYDYILIFAKYNDEVQFEEKLCAKHSQLIRSLFYPEVHVVFVTDGSLQYTGFNATVKQQECGGIVTSLPATIIANNRTDITTVCIWLVELPVGSATKGVAYFDPGITDIDCTEANVTIRLGTQPDSPPLRTFCGPGTVIQNNFKTVSNQLLIELKASKGFQFRIELEEDSSSATGCGQSLSGSRGVILSPNFGKSYPPNQLCEWDIFVMPSHHIVFVFNDFDLQNSSNCSADNLTIAGGAPQYYSPDNTRTFCGSNLGPPVPGSKSSPSDVYVGEKYKFSGPTFVRVIFSTDGSGMGRGFNLSWVQACGDTLTGRTGTFASPNYPSNYPNNANCSYYIDPSPLALETAPSANTMMKYNAEQLAKHKLLSKVTVSLKFIDIDLENGNTRGKGKGNWRSRPVCYDKIRLYGNTAGTVDDICDDMGLGLMTLHKTPFRIDFISDSDNTRRGFRARYEVSSCGGYFYLNETQHSIRDPFSGRHDMGIPHNLNCTYHIVAPSPFVVVVAITNMSLEIPNSEDECTYDYLEFMNVRGSDRVSIKRMCGSFDHPKNQGVTPFVRGNSSEMVVNFVTDGDTQSDSFEFLAYSVYSQNCGGRINVSEENGRSLLASPTGTHDAWYICSWILFAKDGWVIDVKVKNVTIDCDDATLELFDGQSPLDLDLASICIGKVPGMIGKAFHSSTNYVFIKTFFYLGSGSAFELEYSTRPAACGQAQDASNITASIHVPNHERTFRCTYIIFAPAGGRVELWLNNVDLGNGNSCSGTNEINHIDVRDADSNAPSGAHASQLSICSPGNYRFISNSYRVRLTMVKQFSSRSFSASITFRVHDECPSAITLSAAQPGGRLISPGYPRPYKHELNCTIKIQAPPGRKIQIYFNDLDMEIEQGTTRCVYDYLVVNDTSGHSTGPLCSAQHGIPVPFISHSNEVTLHYKTDQSVSRPGFDLTYVANLVTSSACGGKIEAESGSIQGGPHIKETSCSWEIHLINIDENVEVKLSPAPAAWCANPTGELQIYLENGDQRSSYKKQVEVCDDSIQTFTIPLRTTPEVEVELVWRPSQANAEMPTFRVDFRAIRT